MREVVHFSFFIFKKIAVLITKKWKKESKFTKNGYLIDCLLCIHSKEEQLEQYE